MFALPIGSALVDHLLHPDAALVSLVGRWFVFWSVGVRLSLERAETVGQAYELGGPRYWTYGQITREVLKGMGRRRFVVGMPVPLIALVAGVAERLRLPFPVATDQLRQLKLDNIGPLDGYQAAFGIAPREMAGNLGYLARRVRDQEPGPA